MLTIGIVNNMPPAAIRSSERQFDDILTAAAQNIPYQIRWFRLAGARPSHYGRLDDLWDSDLDGLIVTGAEPKAAVLSDEPFWQPLTKAVEWAAGHTSSTIWSCLAAHAAVLHLDGVERHTYKEKIFGVFDSIKVADHELLANAQPRWRVPHSRWNDLPERDLKARGYEVLATSLGAGVDTFVKRFGRSLFVFIQSHPEYDARALMREYRRDIARYRVGEQDNYPKVPQNYFDRQITIQLQLMSNNAASDVAGDTLGVLEGAELPDIWKPMAVQFYHNWLSYLVATRQTSTTKRAMSA
jgi:homoserine O-succinyltransferase